MPEVSGFFNVDKPLHMTSHDIVAKLRRAFNLKKVGHAGTLDPLATGVLVICIGNATRLSEYVMHATKHYRARVRLGITTDTYDAEGEVLHVRDTSGVQYADVQAQLSAFLGDIEQMPPMYSAIKQGGRKLYELARAGQIVERELRPVRIDSLNIVDWSPPELTLDVKCSAGTYIRSLAYDLGEALGLGAHLSGLTRVASGIFQLADAIALDSLLLAPDWQQYVISPEVALTDWPKVQLSMEEVDHIRHGRAIGADVSTLDLAFGYAPDGHLVAILRPHAGLWHPHKVFSA